jgi:hypothetical protein
MDRTRTLAAPQADVEPVAPTQALRPRRSVASREASSRTCARPEQCAGHPWRPGPWRHGQSWPVRTEVPRDVYIIKRAALLRGDARTRRGEHTADARSPAREGRRLGGRDAAPGAGPRPHRRGHERPRGAPAVRRGAHSRNGTGADGRSSGSREGPRSHRRAEPGDPGYQERRVQPDPPSGGRVSHGPPPRTAGRSL